MSDYNSSNYQKQGGAEWVINGEITQHDVDFTIGAEAADVINVAIQLNKPNGVALDRVQHVIAYLSDNADGLNFSTDAPSGGVAIGTDGSLVALGTNTWLLQSEADGDIDLNITEAAGDTWYLVIVGLDGRMLAVSAAITFAA
jgi:hypothetical protein